MCIEQVVVIVTAVIIFVFCTAMTAKLIKCLIIRSWNKER